LSDGRYRGVSSFTPSLLPDTEIKPDVIPALYINKLGRDSLLTAEVPSLVDGSSDVGKGANGEIINCDTITLLRNFD